MKQVKYLVMTALCVALGVVLPVTLHAIPNAGSILLPMHIPVLLCGLVCGPVYGLACGILAPLLSSLITSMPPMAMLPSMYLSLLGAMLIGRVIYGALNSLIFRAGEYSLQLWLTGAFVTALPGIAIQLVLLPVLVLALQKARLVEATV